MKRLFLLSTVEEYSQSRYAPFLKMITKYSDQFLLDVRPRLFFDQNFSQERLRELKISAIDAEVLKTWFPLSEDHVHGIRLCFERKMERVTTAHLDALINVLRGQDLKLPAVQGMPEVNVGWAPYVYELALNCLAKKLKELTPVQKAFYYHRREQELPDNDVGSLLAVSFRATLVAEAQFGIMPVAVQMVEEEYLPQEMAQFETVLVRDSLPILRLPPPKECLQFDKTYATIVQTGGFVAVTRAKFVEKLHSMVRNEVLLNYARVQSARNYYAQTILEFLVQMQFHNYRRELDQIMIGVTQRLVQSRCQVSDMRVLVIAGNFMLAMSALHQKGLLGGYPTMCFDLWDKMHERVSYQGEHLVFTYKCEGHEVVQILESDQDRIPYFTYRTDIQDVYVDAHVSHADAFGHKPDIVVDDPLKFLNIFAGVRCCPEFPRLLSLSEEVKQEFLLCVNDIPTDVLTLLFMEMERVHGRSLANPVVVVKDTNSTIPSVRSKQMQDALKQLVRISRIPPGIYTAFRFGTEELRLFRITAGVFDEFHGLDIDVCVLYALVKRPDDSVSLRLTEGIPSMSVVMGQEIESYGVMKHVGETNVSITRQTWSMALSKKYWTAFRIFPLRPAYRGRDNNKLLWVTVYGKDFWASRPMIMKTVSSKSRVQPIPDMVSDIAICKQGRIWIQSGGEFQRIPELIEHRLY